MVQRSHPYMTTGKTIPLTTRPFVSKVMSLLFNTLSRSVIAVLPRNKHLLTSWLMSQSSDFGAQETKIYHRFHFLPSIFPASWPFPMSQFFASGGQGIVASTSASVLPMNIQAWFPFRLTGLISLQSKGLSRVFSSTIVQKHQFFSAQLSPWSNAHIHTWPLEKP